MKRIYISLLTGVVLLVGANRAQAQIKPETMRQIQSLLDEKASRTPAQRKLQSSLLQAEKEHRGQKMADGINLQPAQVNATADGMVEVDIDANVTDALLAKIKSLGGQILYPSKEYKTIRAKINLSDVETIAAFSDVKFIQPAVQAYITGAGNPTKSLGKNAIKQQIANSLTTTTKHSIAERKEKIKKKLDEYVMMLGTGTVNSEGDHAHRADDTRNTFGYAGQGIKIGIMSDSYNATGTAAANVLNGNLPGVGNPFGYTTPVTVLQDYAGATDEGQAMTQIVHDLAPKAQLYFATANNGAANFAANIKALRAAGCDVIIDDVSYYNEAAFQDGIVAQAVNYVTADGAMYFSSAGNSGALIKGTSGVYEGDFNSTGSLTFAGATKTGGSIHNFGTNTLGDVITKAASGYYNLMWADPIGKSSNDYDLFLVSSTGTVKASSTTVQAGASDPYEQIATATLVAGDQLVVFKAATAAVRAFALNSNRGTLTVATAGQTHGHASAVNAFCVAATPAAGAFSSTSPTGPYPGIFTTANQLETFSSDGPRRIFFNADSTPVSSGNYTFASNGFTTRAKPDITAADGVSTSLSGFNPFYGTSAAAPHAGAIAALLKSAKPSLTPAQIRTILTTTALDIEGSGYEYNSGFGIIQAYQAMQAVNPTPMANVTFGTVTTTEGSFSNGNGIVESGEIANILVQLKNLTAANATNVTATLTTSIAGVNIANATVNYGSLAAGATTTNTSNPFKVGITSSVACGSTITFYVAVNFGGGTASPVGYTFTTTVGTTATLASQSASALGTPVAGAGYTVTTGQQIGRMSRITTGITSTCAAPFANPGLTVTTGARQYDAYTFTNTTGAAQCFTATVTSSNSLNNIYSTAYNNSGFVPANPALNYIGEPAQTYPVYQYSFSVNAGDKFTVVVSAVDSISNPGGNEVGTAYTIGVTYIKCVAPPTCTPVTITTASIAAGAVGSYYSQKITATGNVDGAFIDSLTGALPAGMYFAGDSLYGTPTQAGSFPISVKVTSATGCSSATANYTLTISGNVAAAITATAGTPQTAAPGSIYVTPFKAKVTDARNNPLSGVNVVFTAPASGASGTFTGGTNTITIVTDSAGNATAPSFTANSTTGAYTVTAAVAGTTIPAANFSVNNVCLSTYVVTSNADNGPGTLRSIIANSCSNITITFDPSITNIALTSGEIAITKPLSIVGPGANTLTINGSGLSRAFNITAGTSAVSISGITMTNCKTIAGSTYGGGAVIINGGAFTLSNSVISNSSSLLAGTSDGGGLYNATANTALVTIDRSSIINDTCIRLGGGVANWGTGGMAITNSTIAGNYVNATTGTGSGGGVFFNTALTISNSTIVNNTAYGFGGNIQRNGTTPVLTMGNTIVAGGVLTLAGQLNKDINGAFTSTGYNLIQNSTGTSITGVTTGNLLNVNANLLPLANYGGTMPTVLPMSSSPAVGGGNTALTSGTDQRSLPRYVGGRADIGAVETNYVVTLTAGTPQSTLINTAFATPLQAKVTESGNNIAGDSLTFTAPATGASATFPSGTRLGSVVTNASGVAAITATANSITGTYNIIGSAGSVFTPLTYVLTNNFIPVAFTTCPNVNLIISRPGYNTYNGEAMMMYNMDTTTGAAALIAGGPLKDSLTGKNIEVNGAGLNAQDGFVYAIRDTINTAGTTAAPLLYRIGSNYANTVLGTLPSSPLLSGENLSVVIPSAGTFDDQGNYYYVAMSGSYSFTGNSFTPSSYYIGKVANVASFVGGTGPLAATWVKVDFTSAPATFKTAMTKAITSASGTGTGSGFQDITYSRILKSFYVYSAYSTGAAYSGQLFAINPTTGVASFYANPSAFGAANNEVAGISTISNGSLRVFMTSGDIYKPVISGGNFTSTLVKVGTSGVPLYNGTGSLRGDLASCNTGTVDALPSLTPPSITIGLPNQIIAYPNPAQGITTISVGQTLTNATVRLLGSNGNVIAEKNGVSGTTFQMDMTGKAGGMYTVEVIQGGNVQVVKIIKP